MFKLYKNKKIFITGHTGFKGTWLQLWLEELGAKVYGYSLAPEKESLHALVNVKQGIYEDILHYTILKEKMQEFQPEFVFHLAAQSLVRPSYEDPIKTYQVNVLGTLHVLEAAKATNSVKVFVNVTSDKCYENKGHVRDFTEEDTMGGHDIYSSSKACVELLSASYKKSFLENGFLLSCVRAGNVIGGGDFAKNRLIPDAMRSFHAKKPVVLRYPKATRPWQHVLEPLAGYLLVAKKMYTETERFSENFNFGPNKESILTVEEIVNKIIQYYGYGEISLSKEVALHEAEYLSLNSAKAQSLLSWKSKITIDKALELTVAWYKEYHNTNANTMHEFTLSQIKQYNELYTISN